MTETRPASFKLLFTALLTGFFANLQQVSLFRYFIGNFYGTEIHLGLFLGIWLAGTAAGGFSGGRLKLNPLALSLATVFLPIVTIATLTGGINSLPVVSGSFLAYGPVIKLMFLTVFPAAALTGMMIPTMVRVSRQSIGFFYSLESVGAFAGGIMFSILIGGITDPIFCLLILPLPMMASVFILTDRKKTAAVLTLIIAPTAFYLAPQLSSSLEKKLWNRLNQTQKLEKTVESPYQKLQLCSYHELNSIYSNGMFADSWPMAENAENRAHTFMSALKNTGDILIIGAPTVDLLIEFLKYPQTRLTIVEIDEMLIQLLNYPPEILKRVSLETVDPRFFLNSSQKQFDGIFVNQISPVTMAGNRMFTVEAFRSASLRLKSEGVFAIQVTGSENYLGATTEKLILSIWNTFKSVFNYNSALPGSSLTFLGSNSPNSIPSSAREFSSRFSARKILTATFQPMSFYNILMPFRVEELNKWLARKFEGPLNLDVHPGSFLQQLELWNIYSGSGQQGLSRVIEKASAINPWVFFLLLSAAAIFIPMVMSDRKGAALLISCGVGVSGATGLLAEIILILVYQNRFGAAYQMTAFFFAVYMLGLAAGSVTNGYIQNREIATKRIFQVKLLQILFTAFCIYFVDSSALHSGLSISLMIFLIALIDGIEFPVADSILRNLGIDAHNSAGLLLFSDNAGALFSGFLSGLILLPALGMKGSFYLLLIFLTANLVSLLFFRKRLQYS